MTAKPLHQFGQGRDEGEPVGLGAWAGGDPTPSSPGCPCSSCSGKCHFVPSKKSCRHWQSAPQQQHPSNPCWTRPTSWAGKVSGCFSSFPDPSPGCREAQAGGSFDLRLYFHIKETLELHSLPSSGGSQGVVTAQSQGSITDALSSSPSTWHEPLLMSTASPWL